MTNRYTPFAFAALCTILIASNCFAQEPGVAPQSEKSADERIVELEGRVERLEELLFASVQLSVYDAQRRLAIASREREQNQRLFYRGLLAAIDLERSVYEVERAHHELELARATSGHRLWSSRIEVLDAEFELKFALDALERNREYAGRGLVTEYQLKQNTESVERAKRALEFAKQKLEALEPMAPASDSAAETDKNTDK